MPGTTATLALELGRLLDPIRTKLQTPQGVVELFNDLGLPLPQDVQNAPQVVAAISDAATVLGRLPPLVANLASAIASQNEAAIAAALQALLPDARDAFTKSKSIAERVKAAYEARGPIAAELQDIVSQLPERLADHLLVAYLEGFRPVLARSLALFGVVESISEAVQGTRPAYIRRDLRLDRLGDLGEDPTALAQTLYGWGTSNLDQARLFERLRDLLAALRVPAVLDPTGSQLSAFIFTLREAPGTTAALDLLLGFGDMTGVNVPIPIGRSGDWQVRFRGAGSASITAGLRITPPLTVTPLAPGVAAGAELSVALERQSPPGTVEPIFGAADGTRLEARTVRAGVGARFRTDAAGVTADALAEAVLEDGRLVISFAGADGFLSSFLPRESTLDLDLAVEYDEQQGLTIRGGAGFAMTIPLALDLGPARLERIDLAFKLAGTGMALEARATGNVALGPFAASVDGVGAGADLAFRDGNLGPVDLTFRFIAPSGLGLAVEAGPIRGGGFIRYEEALGRYSGILELGIGEIGITAVGLLDTRLPGGQQGFALLVVLRAQFPPIQIGFGFALSSVGGLLALNRRFDVDALRQRFASGTAGRILAPEDPIRNAPVLLADLAAVFPPAGGVSIVGPTLQLSWVEIVRFDIGVFVELPQVRVVLLGSARAGIPNPTGGRPLLQLRVDILGLIDFQRRILEFDAVLVDSHLLEVFDLTGGAAMRLSWGEQPYVVLSVGGFHPGWSPAPLVLPPSLTRIAATRGTPSDALYLRLEGYFAITTNTLQVGASVEAIVNAGSINARGFIGFDSLIRFQPFFFIVDFEASVKVRYKSRTLGGVELDGTLSGPGPVTLRGKLCIEILFFDVCWSDTFTFGSTTTPQVTPVASAVAELAAELSDPVNLSGTEADDPRVVLRPEPAGLPLPVVRPGGQLVWSQDRAPLDLLLQRFEAAPLTRPETVAASGPHVTGAQTDWFAPGGFAELADSDALNRKAFERLNAGVRIGSPGVTDGRQETKQVTVQQIRLPQPPVIGFDFSLPAWLLRAANARAGSSEALPIAALIGAREETWTVAGTDGVVVAAGLSQAQAHQVATLRPGGGAAVADADVLPAFAF